MVMVRCQKNLHLLAHRPMLLRREKELACLVHIFVQTEMETFVKMFEKFIDTMTDLLSNYGEAHK